MFHWLIFSAYGALIFYSSSQPLPNVLVKVPDIDLVIHFVEYGIFAWLAYRAFAQGGKKVLPKHLWFVIVLTSILYGFSDEWHQAYVPGRVTSVSDFIFDALGSIGMTGLLYFKRADK